jgi:hypothetical protein
MDRPCQPHAYQTLRLFGLLAALVMLILLGGLSPHAQVSADGTKKPDVSHISVTPVAGTTTTEGGETAVFNVVLDQVPVADITIAISSDDPTEGLVSPSTLTFTAADYGVEQQFTVAGQPDGIDDGDVAYTVTWTVISTGDAAYDGDTGTVNLTNQDINGPVVTVGAGSVTEGNVGTTPMVFPISLAASPDDITITYSTVAGTATAGSDYSAVSGGTVTITHGATSGSITINIIGDYVVENTETFNLALSVDPTKASLSSSTVTGTITDNDTAGFTITPATTPGLPLTTTEATGASHTATFNVVLTSQPTVNVTITSTSQDTTEGQVTSGGTLTFTSANWNTPQTVTVTGQDDLIADGNVAYTVQVSAGSADTNYNTLPAQTVYLNSVDNGVPGFTITPATSAGSPLTTTEAGGTATYNVVLTSQPTANVTITSTVNTPPTPAEGQITTGASLTFTTANWNIAQQVIVTGVNDFIVDGSVAYTVQVAPSSTDLNYNALPTQTVYLVNTDNDVAGFTISPATTAGTPLITTEAAGINHTATYTVVLTSQPASSVTITSTVITPPTPAEGQITTGGTLTFTTGNWNVAQPVTVTAVDDLIQDGNKAYSIQVRSTSSDPNYNYPALADQTVYMVNNDNDVAGITIAPGTATNPATPLFTSESGGIGGQASFTVALNTQPTANVLVSLSSSNVYEGTISPALLQFTTSNWSTPQTVIVLGQPDGSDDGDQPYQVNLSLSLSSDPVYAALSAGPVYFINRDINGPTITVTAPVSFTEGDAGLVNMPFTVTLSAASPDDITLNYYTSDGTATAGNDYVAVPSGTLTILHGATSGTINIQIIGDTLFEGNETFNLNLSVDPTKATLSSATVVGTIIDNEGVPNIILDPVTFEVTEGTFPATSQATFTVKLSPPSSSPVSVMYSTADGTAIAPNDYDNTNTLNQTLTFNTGETSKTINVPIVADAIDEPDETFTLTISNPNPTSVVIPADKATATATIKNDDPPPTVQFTAPTFTGLEGTNGTATVELSTVSGKTVTVDYSMTDGTATSPADYTALSGMLTFLPNESIKAIQIPLKADKIKEPDETFTIHLGDNPTNAALNPAARDATFTIKEGSNWMYMPAIMNKPKPDLTGTLSIQPSASVQADAAVTLLATITNQGSLPTGVFYVDLYFNPSLVPPVPNMDYQYYCTSSKYCDLIIWQVANLEPGETIILSSAEPDKFYDHWYWNGSFPGKSIGTNDLYLLVDSWDADATAIGSVDELREDNNVSKLTVTVLK